MSEDGIRFDRSQVERIIARAVEDEVNGEETYSSADIVRIASELGVAPEVIARAITTELSGARTSTRRGVLPGHIGASRLVRGTEEEIAAKTHDWLAKSEGMRVRRRHGELEVWEKDPRPLANIRAGLGLNAGGKELRATGAVEVVRTPVPGGVTLSMEASGAYQRGAALGIAAGFTAVGVGGALGLTLAASQPWAWIYLFVPLLVVGVVVAVAASRAWASTVEGAMERALDGIAEGAPPASDTVADVIGDLRDSFKSRSASRRAPRKRTLDL